MPHGNNVFETVLVGYGLFEPPKNGHGYRPDRTSKPYRWAHYQVTTDTSTYSIGGEVMDFLDELQDWEPWTRIVGYSIPMFLMDGEYWVAELKTPNDSTPSNRKIQFFVAVDHTEHTSSSMAACTFDMFVWGY